MAFTLLVVYSDTTMQRTINKFLKSCEHREIGEGNLNDCMNSLMKVQETLSPYMLTNMNRLNRPGIPCTTYRVQKLLNSNIIGVCEGGEKITRRGGNSFTVYTLNISSLAMMNQLWEKAMAAAPPVDKTKPPSSSDSVMTKNKEIVTSSSSSKEIATLHVKSSGSGPGPDSHP